MVIKIAHALAVVRRGPAVQFFTCLFSRQGVLGLGDHKNNVVDMETVGDLNYVHFTKLVFVDLSVQAFEYCPLLPHRQAFLFFMRMISRSPSVC